MTATEQCFSCRQKLCAFLTEDGHLHNHRMLTLARGERLETCEVSCLKFWIVVNGTAAICTMLKDGRRQISGIERSGDTICGPMAAPETPIWLEALEPATVCELDFENNAAALRQDPGFLMAMFGVVHKRLEDASRHLTTLGRLDSTERLIHFLADNAIRSGNRQPVRLPMSREDIADYLGLNAETVSRIFSRVRKTGLFAFSSPTDYVVPNLEAIRRRLPVPLAKPVGNPMANIAGQETGDMEKAG